jgi:hypothetical protein
VRLYKECVDTSHLFLPLFCINAFTSPLSSPLSSRSGIDPIKTDAMIGFLTANADRPPTVVSQGAMRSMDSRAGGGFGRWKSKVLSRMSYHKGADEEEDDSLAKDVNTSNIFFSHIYVIGNVRFEIEFLLQINKICYFVCV